MDFSKQLYEALERLDKDKVRYLVESELSDNGVLTVEMICRALEMNQQDAAILILMAMHRNYDVTDESAFKLILEAMRLGHTEFIKMLMTLDNERFARAEAVVHDLNLAQEPRPRKVHASPLHECVANGEPTPLIFLYALMTVPVNIQNKAGETALHLAALARNAEMVEALLQVGVSPMLRNRLGQTAADVALQDNNPTLAALIRSYEPGLTWGLDSGDATRGGRAVARAVRRWVSPSSYLDGAGEGRTGLRMARDAGLEHCVGSPSLVVSVLLAHRVMADDVRGVRAMFADPEVAPILNLKLRHCDSGMTPLAAAVRNHNGLIISELLSRGATVNIRVYNVPLITKAMEWKVPFPIIKELLMKDNEQCHGESTIWRERDGDGLTLFHRAILSERPCSEIEELLYMSPGRQCLAHRTADKKLNARELAEDIGRSDVVEVIDAAVAKLLERTGRSTEARTALMGLAIAFYGAANFECAAADLADDEKVRRFLRGLPAIEAGMESLMKAVEDNNYVAVKSLNQADYIDKNGYTALTRAIVFDRHDIAQWLVAERPQLRLLSDNDGRYPLHFAYALPQEIGDKYATLMLSRDGAALEELSDKDGDIPCTYRRRAESEELLRAVEQVRTLDVRGSPK